jgi:hypothetical protein
MVPDRTSGRGDVERGVAARKVEPIGRSARVLAPIGGSVMSRMIYRVLVMACTGG